VPDVPPARTFQYRPPSSEPELAIRLAEASGRVSVQADCTMDEALQLMHERALLTGHTVQDVADAVCRHEIWFS